MADSYAAELVNAVKKLNEANSENCNTIDYLKTVTTLETNWWDFRKEYGDMCDKAEAFNVVGFPSTTSQPGFVPAFVKYSAAFEDAFLKNNDSKLVLPVVNAYLPFLRVMVSAVDDSAPLCKEVEELNAAVPLLKFLDTPEFLSARDNDILEHEYGLHALNCVILFANICYRVPDIGNALKAHNGHEILTKYNQSKNKILALRTLIAQSYLLQDPKGNELPVTDDMLNFIWQTVNRKLQRESAGVGDFTLYGLLVYLHQLLKCSEACAVGLVRCGFVDSMVAIMTAPPGNGKGKSTPGEKRTCAKICWTLALFEDCGDDFVKALSDTKVISALVGIKIVREDLYTAATAALWQIKLRSRHFAKHSEPADSHESTVPTLDALLLSDSKRRIVISYVSDYKPELVKSICSELDKLAIKTWMYSEDESEGDMYDEMAVAIENSPAILVCYSSEFSETQHCLSQVSYAQQLKKILIPVRLENYTPRGVLGLWLAGQEVFDFADVEAESSEFDEAIGKLTAYVNSKLDNNI